MGWPTRVPCSQLLPRRDGLSPVCGRGTTRQACTGLMEPRLHASHQAPCQTVPCPVGVTGHAERCGDNFCGRSWAGVGGARSHGRLPPGAFPGAGSVKGPGSPRRQGRQWGAGFCWDRGAADTHVLTETSLCHPPQHFWSALRAGAWARAFVWSFLHFWYFTV